MLAMLIYAINMLTGSAYYAHIMLYHVTSEHAQYMHKMATPESAETSAPASASASASASKSLVDILKNRALEDYVELPMML